MSVLSEVLVFPRFPLLELSSSTRGNLVYSSAARVWVKFGYSSRAWALESSLGTRARVALEYSGPRKSYLPVIEVVQAKYYQHQKLRCWISTQVLHNVNFQNSSLESGSNSRSDSNSDSVSSSGSDLSSSTRSQNEYLFFW